MPTEIPMTAFAGNIIVMMLAWLIPLATFVVTVVLALRFVRAVERIARAAEDLARRPR